MRTLIIDEMHKSIIPLLEGIGHEVSYRPEINRKEILEIISNYEGLVVRSKTDLDRALLEKAERLKFIGRAGAGIEKIDIDYLNIQGIHLLNAPEGNKDAVGEHAIGMLLALFNHFSKGDQEVRKGVWLRDENRGEELCGKTVGVIGYGNMGKAFAEKLSGFGVKILVYDKYKTGFSSALIKESSFEEIQEQADVLSLHVPLTSETKDFLTISIIEGFKKPFYLINTARGEIISFDTLNESLQRGLLKGAVLDVLENEKLNQLSQAQKMSFEKLASRNNVLFTPHVAGWTHQSYEKINQVLVEKISKLKF
jgi:D-3-phosphoglycerate dehydrogenase / 2-oxoglutarate reductase